MNAGEDPWSGPGKLKFGMNAGEDPWSGPGEKESGMGRGTVATRRRAISAKKEKREMALWTCGVFCPDLKSVVERIAW